MSIRISSPVCHTLQRVYVSSTDTNLSNARLVDASDSSKVFPIKAEPIWIQMGMADYKYISRRTITAPVGDYHLITDGVKEPTTIVKVRNLTELASKTFENQTFYYKHFMQLRGWVFYNCSFQGCIFDRIASDCVFVDCHFTGTVSEHTFTCWGTENLTFINCTFEDTDRGPNFGLGEINGLTMYGTILKDICKCQNGMEGIHFENARVNQALIMHTRVFNCFGAGLQIFGSSFKNSIVENFVQIGGRGIVILGSKPEAVTGNLFKQITLTQGALLRVENAKDNKFLDLIISNPDVFTTWNQDWYDLNHLSDPCIYSSHPNEFHGVVVNRLRRPVRNFTNELIKMNIVDVQGARI